MVHENLTPSNIMIKEAFEIAIFVATPFRAPAIFAINTSLDGRLNALAKTKASFRNKSLIRSKNKIINPEDLQGLPELLQTLPTAHPGSPGPHPELHRACQGRQSFPEPLLASGL